MESDDVWSAAQGPVLVVEIIEQCDENVVQDDQQQVLRVEVILTKVRVVNQRDLLQDQHLKQYLQVMPQAVRSSRTPRPVGGEIKEARNFENRHESNPQQKPRNTANDDIANQAVIPRLKVIRRIEGEAPEARQTEHQLFKHLRTG
eukprot:589144-Hanusia_phi.AAC.1